MRKSPLILFGAALTLVLSVLAPTAVGAHPRSGSGHSSAPVVVVSGLNNPRQLSLVDGVELLIAEAGKGGSIEIAGGEMGPTFVGPTGSISAVYLPQRAHDRTPHRIVTGLLSGAGPDGSFATGSDGVSSRSVFGPIYIQETLFPPDPALEPQASVQSGKLLKTWPYSSHLRSVADISGYEATHDPDGHGVDSNPYAVLARAHDELVADAAGNVVLRVDRYGKRHVFHVFRNVTSGPCADQFDPDADHPGCNFVPTSLATDWRGHVYVGGLVSEVPGQGRVVELTADGRHVLHVWTGFTSVTGVAVGNDGAIYVSQLEAAEAAPPDPQIVGVLTKIGWHGKRTNVDVPFPAGVAVDRHNNVYVSAWSVASEAGLAGPGTSGQVWRLRF